MTIYIRLDMDGQFYVEHLVNASRMAKHELSANDTCALNENERKRSTNLVQQVYVEHLENASQRLIEIFINTRIRQNIPLSLCIMFFTMS